MAALGQSGQELDRRRLIKAASGLAVGTVVWTEPTVRGLARRPAFASVSSATLNGMLASQFSPDHPVTDPLTITIASTTLAGVEISAVLSGQATSWTVSAVSSDPNCLCSFVSGTLNVVYTQPAPGQLDSPFGFTSATLTGGTFQIGVPPTAIELFAIGLIDAEFVCS